VNAEAYRVPVADGSVSDITFKLDREASLDRVRELLEEFEDQQKWEVLQIVDSIHSSVELIGNPHDAVVDGSKIAVIDGNIVRVRSGYDNAYGPARAALDAMHIVRSK